MFGLTLTVLRPLLAGVARRALEGTCIEQSQAADVLGETLARLRSAYASLPRERTVGARLMVRSAALTVCFHDTLLARGLPEPEARQVTARATWIVYAWMGRIPWLLARMTTRSPLGRMRRATRLFRTFPFGLAGYVMVDVDAGSKVVAFDVRRCPVAEYFKSRDRSQLCTDSWCNLDFPLAIRWGGRLERELTIARGDTRCDFRWRVDLQNPG